MAKLRSIVKLTAANTDAFSGTDLETVPGPGLLQIWAASTVDTATLTAVLGAENIARAVAIPLRTNGVPSQLDDPAIVQAPVGGGERNIANVGGTTGTVFLVGEWTPLDEM